MDIKELLTEDRAVSPVIGVILMVAITVILAAVIGAFVLGLGDNVSETAPSAQIDFDYEEAGTAGQVDITLTHDGGNSFQSSAVTLVGPNGPVAGENNLEDWGTDGTVSAGNSETVTGVDGDGDGEIREGDTIRVVWQGDGGSSSTIARSTVPDRFA